MLFLVDRGNLGRQTLKEFQPYVTPDDGRKFTELYNVQHLTSNRIDPVQPVCITTIQRLYSMLRGEDEFDPADEEESLFERRPPERSRCRSPTTRASRSRRSTSSSPTSATARSTTCGGRCWSTSTPS